MPAARLLAGEGVEAEQLAELEEVGHPPGLLQRLVERRRAAGHLDVGVELLAERGDVGQGLLQRLPAAGRAAGRGSRRWSTAARSSRRPDPASVRWRQGGSRLGPRSWLRRARTA